MIPEGLGCWLEVMLDCKTILVSAQTVWVVLGDLRHQWVVMLDQMCEISLCLGGLGGSRGSGVLVGG